MRMRYQLAPNMIRNAEDRQISGWVVAVNCLKQTWQDFPLVFEGLENCTVSSSRTMLSMSIS